MVEKGRASGYKRTWIAIVVNTIGQNGGNLT